MGKWKMLRSVTKILRSKIECKRGKEKKNVVFIFEFK